MHFALTSLPRVAGRVWGDSAETTTQLKLLNVFHRPLFSEGRSARGNFNSHFNLNILLSQNYQDHTCESGKSFEEDPGTSLFYPSRGIPDLLPSFLPTLNSLSWFSSRFFSFSDSTWLPQAPQDSQVEELPLADAFSTWKIQSQNPSPKNILYTQPPSSWITGVHHHSRLNDL